jgi:hypothetical protein
MTVTIGLWPEPFVNAAARAAGELFDPRPYLFAVLGARP